MPRLVGDGWGGGFIFARMGLCVCVGRVLYCFHGCVTRVATPCSAVSADNAGVTKELETLFQECVAADSSIVSKVTKLDMRRFLRYAAKVRRLLPHVVVSRVP